MTDVKENLEQSLELLFKIEKQPSKKKALLDKPKMVFLLIGLFKVPYVPSPKKKFVNLHHSVYGDDPEVCLFVPNRKSKLEYKITTDEMIDSCINHYTELLEKHKIKGISTVMPLKQLKSEYGTYELRRKLVRRFDLFLCKNSLLYNPRFLTALGKHFREANREPLGVAFPKEDADFDPEFQKNIDRAIRTSTFTIKRSSDNYAIPVGHMGNTKSQLRENIETALDQILSQKMIPGGIKNIKVMYLLPYQSKPVPLYFNPDIPPKNGRPRIKANKKRKMPVGVEGELSTQPGKKVMVMPNGDVFVTQIENGNKEEVESESDDSFRDDSEDEEEVKTKEKSKTQKEDEESESEDDEEIEEREERLLREKRNAENDPSEKGNKLKETEDDEDDEESEEEMPKVKKPQKGKNMKKSNRKLVIKQEKFKAKEKLKQKMKSKQKKV